MKILAGTERRKNHACFFTNASPEKRIKLPKFVSKLKEEGQNQMFCSINVTRFWRRTNLHLSVLKLDNNYFISAIILVIF